MDRETRLSKRSGSGAARGKTRAGAPKRASTSRPAPHNGHPRGTPRTRHGHTAGRLGRGDGHAFRGLLEAERRRLREEIETLSRRAAQADDQVRAGGDGGDDGLIDAAVQTLERDRESAVETSLRALLDEIELALQRLVTGVYGFCERCQRPITQQRLRAIPYATLCIECKSQQERALTWRGAAPFREWRLLKVPEHWEEDDPQPEPRGSRRSRSAGGEA
jgi:RNA polymerase-binding protein DksA